MRIVLVMSEASLWKPGFVQGVIDHLPPQHEIVAGVLTSFKPRRVSRLKNVSRYFAMLGPAIFVRIAIREVFHSRLDRLDRLYRLPTPHSIAGVCRRYGIPTIRSHNVNHPETVAWLRDKKPDILLSSGNQILKEEVLTLPTTVCLNRHTSLLPAYGGIYPIFWCLLNDEEEVGVSVHTMTKKIDKGVVVAQHSMPVKPGDTFFSLFGACFHLSIDVVLEAIEKVASGEYEPVENGRERSYFSYPTREDVRQFRRLGKRMM